MIKITRHNWREFVTEPDLTKAEWQEWYKVAERVRDDDDFATALFEATKDEHLATLNNGLTWEGLVKFAEAHRYYIRAVIAAAKGIE